MAGSLFVSERTLSTLRLFAAIYAKAAAELADVPASIAAKRLVRDLAKAEISLVDPIRKRLTQPSRPMINSPLKAEDAQTLAQAIVNTIHEPFIVLDAELRVLAANRSFYETFQVDPDETRAALLYALGDGQWDIPALRELLETVLDRHTEMNDFEVACDFPRLCSRSMLLNARMVEQEKAELLGKTEDLVRQKQVLLQEMEHRVANSL